MEIVRVCVNLQIDVRINTSFGGFFWGIRNESPEKKRRRALIGELFKSLYQGLRQGHFPQSKPNL